MPLVSVIARRLALPDATVASVLVALLDTRIGDYLPHTAMTPFSGSVSAGHRSAMREAIEDTLSDAGLERATRYGGPLRDAFNHVNAEDMED